MALNGNSAWSGSVHNHASGKGSMSSQVVPMDVSPATPSSGGLPSARHKRTTISRRRGERGRGRKKTSEPGGPRQKKKVKVEYDRSDYSKVGRLVFESHHGSIPVSHLEPIGILFVLCPALTGRSLGVL